MEMDAGLVLVIHVLTHEYTLPQKNVRNEPARNRVQRQIPAYIRVSVRKPSRSKTGFQDQQRAGAKQKTSRP